MDLTTEECKYEKEQENIFRESITGLDIINELEESEWVHDGTKSVHISAYTKKPSCPEDEPASEHYEINVCFTDILSRPLITFKTHKHFNKDWIVRIIDAILNCRSVKTDKLIRVRNDYCEVGAMTPMGMVQQLKEKGVLCIIPLSEDGIISNYAINGAIYTNLIEFDPMFKKNRYYKILVMNMENEYFSIKLEVSESSEILLAGILEGIIDSNTKELSKWKIIK